MFIQAISTVLFSLKFMKFLKIFQRENNSLIFFLQNFYKAMICRFYCETILTDIKETDLYELLEINTGIKYKDGEKRICVAVDGRYYTNLKYIGIRHCRDIDQPVLLALECKRTMYNVNSYYYLHIFPLEKILFYSFELDESIYNVEKIEEIIDNVCYIDEKKENDD